MISTSLGPTFVYWCAQIAKAMRARASSTPPAMMRAMTPPARATTIRCEPPRARRRRRRPYAGFRRRGSRSEEHTSELQSRLHLVCRLLLEKKNYPGYVLVDMLKNQETLHTINGIQGVIKFVGTGREPMPLRPDEVNRLLGIEEAVKREEPQETIPFLIGQVVEITEGPFSDFSGTVEEAIPDKGKGRVAVSLFGRPTSVELDYLQLKAH